MENKKLLGRMWEYITADPFHRANHFSEFDTRLRFSTNPPREEVIMLLKEEDRLKGHEKYPRGQTMYNKGHLMVIGTTSPDTLFPWRERFPSKYRLTPQRGTSKILANQELSTEKGCLLGETWDDPDLHMDLKADEILIGLKKVYKGLDRVYHEQISEDRNKSLIGEIGRIYGESFS